MKKIYKTVEPQSLANYRSSINTKSLEDKNIFNDYPNKTKSGCIENESFNLRKQLLDEQGHLCCYCMSRINCKNSKVEHFKSQKNYRDLQLDYQNLFLSCKGGEGSTFSNQFCDTKKGESELNYINLLSNIENNILYEKKGAKEIRICSSDENINKEIDEVLNLNCSILSKNRREQYDYIIRKLKQENFTTSSIKKIIEYYKIKHNDKFEPFNQMIIFFLNKKLQAQGVKA